MINTDTGIDLTKYISALDRADGIRQSGRVKQVIGLVIESQGPSAQIGEICCIQTNGGEPIKAEVVGFKENKVLLMPLGEMDGLMPGSDVQATGESLEVGVGFGLLGRVLGGLGEPIDGKGPLAIEDHYCVSNQPPNPLHRRRIEEPLSVGIKAIDSILTCGKGQRIGIFSGSGVGKSTLMGMLARNTEADINVIALIGERGREVRDFIEKDLGPEGLKRSVVIAATSDQPALVRLKGAFVATAIAEFFRDQGKDVMLMMDSVTRFAMAQREVGLAIGEPPTTRGYTPSVFATLPKLLERSGSGKHGSITGLYTVLVEADDMNEPIADAVRSILDGHIVLSRRIASKNHYPAIDVLESVSRLMIDVVSPLHNETAGRLRDLLATYKDAEDLINIGAYVSGSNPRIDQAIEKIDAINGFLKQNIDENFQYEQTVASMLELLGERHEGGLEG